MAQTVHIVPHTHWDREWYSSFQVFRAQLVELWDALLDLTETEPAFRFLMDGQAVVIEDYLAVRPEMRARLEQAVAKGRIDVGPWYTLPDEFLVSGESLVRNLERGMAVADTHGGSMRVGYLPDSFGHAAQMPQIYSQFGFRHAVVWRGVPAQIDRLVFCWQAPDGSEVLTAYMGNSYAHGVDLPLDPQALAARIRIALAAMAPFRPGAEVLLMNGNDHVLPQAGLAPAAEAASKELDGVSIRVSRLSDYLADLPDQGWPRIRGELRASSRANVLMGTLSVRSADKRRAAAAARALERAAEPLSALSRVPVAGLLQEAWTLCLQNAAHDTACGSGIDEVAEDARQRSRAALEIAEAIAQRGLRRLAARAHRHSPDGSDGRPASGRDSIDVMVWNPSPFRRRALVEADLDVVPAGAQDLGPAPARLAPRRSALAATELPQLLSNLDEQKIAGEVIRSVGMRREGAVVRVLVETAARGAPADLGAARAEAERLATTEGVERFELEVRRLPLRRVLVESGPVEGLALGAVSGIAPEAPPVSAGDRWMDNGLLRLEVDDNGTFTVVDREAGTTYSGLARLVDEGDAGDEYNFSPPNQQRAVEKPSAVESVRCLERGPLRAMLEINLRYRLPASLAPDRSRRAEAEVDLPIRMRLWLENGSSRITGELWLRNQSLDHRLRLHFPLPFSADHSCADGAFYVNRRPPGEARREAGSGEVELPTYPMRSFVDASDGQRGLAVITDGLHEYELLAGSELAITLLRGVGWLSRDDLTYRVGHAGPALETPGAQEVGEHTYRFGVVFHRGDWELGGVWRAAEEVLLPFRLVGADQAVSSVELSGGLSDQDGLPVHESIELEPDSIQMTALIPRPGGFDLRLLNASDRPHRTRVAIRPLPVQVTAGSLAGEKRGAPAVVDGSYELALRPWEIATLRVRN